jgi:SAM-dependent methyltransferase
MLAARGRPLWADWVTGTHARADSRILDVGCGEGELLEYLAVAGYRNLTGIDPFIEPVTDSTRGYRIFRRTLDEEHGTYDVVMLHHSLEHVTDPAATLRDVRRVVHPNGRVLVRLPVAGSYGWRTYRESWLGLEPPRHLFIPSVEGMRRLAADAGLQIESTVFDGPAACYALSELWAVDKTFERPRRPWQKRATDMLGTQRVNELTALAAQKNAESDGDQACFYMTPV